MKLLDIDLDDNTSPTVRVEALRYDEGKPDFTYLEKELREGVANVMAYGAQKYSRDNWKKSINTEKHDEYMQSILGCLLRHAYAIAEGEGVDEESGQSHMAHVATNAMMYLAYQERRNDV